MLKKRMQTPVNNKTCKLFENPQLGVYTSDEITVNVLIQKQLINPLSNISIFLICTFKILFLSCLIITLSLIFILTKSVINVIQLHK